MELPQDIASCHRIILDLKLMVEEQAERITRLETQLNQNSRNSHRPPSSDGFRQGPALPRGKGGKSGGQKGHDGHTLKWSAAVDERIDHKPEVCAGCGKRHGQEALVLRARRQVFDIPLPRIVVSEHAVYSWQCSRCAQANRGDFPAGVSAPVQYGTRLKTLSVLLNSIYCLSWEKTGQLLHDLFGVRVNDRTQQAANEAAFAALAPEETYIRDQLMESAVVHVDETGLRFDDRRGWLHVASNAGYTHLFIHPNRGRKAHTADSPSILVDFEGWAVHDCYAPYFNFGKARHALCGAHLLRELKAQEEQGTTWALGVHQFLLDLYQRTERGRAALPFKEYNPARKDFLKLLGRADAAEPPPRPNPTGKPTRTKGQNLLRRLEQHWEAVLAFAYYRAVPFTNNQAERDIRPAKTKNKVSGRFRTRRGADHYARIQSFVSTVRKQQHNPFKELFTVLSGGNPAYHCAGC